jgi:hypothetical protein
VLGTRGRPLPGSAPCSIPSACRRRCSRSSKLIGSPSAAARITAANTGCGSGMCESVDRCEGANARLPYARWAHRGTRTRIGPRPHGRWCRCSCMHSL